MSIQLCCKFSWLQNDYNGTPCSIRHDKWVKRDFSHFAYMFTICESAEENLNFTHLYIHYMKSWKRDSNFPQNSDFLTSPRLRKNLHFYGHLYHLPATFKNSNFEHMFNLLLKCKIPHKKKSISKSLSLVAGYLSTFNFIFLQRLINLIIYFSETLW